MVEPIQTGISHPSVFFTNTSESVSHPTTQPNILPFRHDVLRESTIQIPLSQEIPNLNTNPVAINQPNVEEDIVNTMRSTYNMGTTNRESIEVTDGRQLENVIEFYIQPTQRSNGLVVKRKARYRVKAQFVFNLVVLISYLFGYLLVNKQITLDIPFGCFNVGAVLYIMFLLTYTSSSSENEKVSLALAVGNVIGLIIFAVGAFLKSKGIDILVSPFGLLGFLFLIGSCLRLTPHEISASNILILGQQVTVWLEILLIGLRVDGVSISWSSTFIPLYVAIVILSISAVFIFIGTVFAFFTIMKEEGISVKLIVGSIWYILNTFYPAIWLSLLTEITQTFELGVGDLKVTLEAGLAHSGFLLVYTLTLYKFLCKFQELEIESEMLLNEAHRIHINENAANKDPEIQFKVSKENNKYLMMISPTFYTYLTRKLSSRDKKCLKKLETQVENAKLDTHRQGLNSTFHTPHKNDLSLAQIKLNSRLDLSERDIEAHKQATRIDIKKRESIQINEHLCAVCYEKVPNAVLMQCGHGGVCYECALENWKKSDKCLMCRQKVDQILKITHYRSSNIIKIVESTKKIVKVQ